MPKPPLYNGFYKEFLPVDEVNPLLLDYSRGLDPGEDLFAGGRDERLMLADTAMRRQVELDLLESSRREVEVLRLEADFRG
jgi:hypothetical protein